MEASERHSEALIRARVKKAYGFIPDTSLSPFHNAVRLRRNCSMSNLSRPNISTMPSNMAFHDLTPNKSAPPNAKSLLGLGPKFICTPKFTTGSIFNGYDRLEVDFHRRVFFAGDPEEPVDPSLDDAPPPPESKLYIRSKWRPDLADIPDWVPARLSKFYVRIQRLYTKKQADSNILPFQERLLELLASDPKHLYPLADKGLGPCCVLYEQYVEDCLVHLMTESVYERMSLEEAQEAAKDLQTKILKWLDDYEHVVGPKVKEYIEHHMSTNSLSPFGQFYIMYKIHKGIGENGRWPTRPVCSDVTSIPHALGKWITEMLLPIAKAQPSYFKDSFVLKALLDVLQLPPNARLFTADAVSMYTNIKTKEALEAIGNFIVENHGEFPHLDPNAVREALHLVFENNIFAFGDTYWRQTSGTAMGTPPAPAWATIFYALHESNMVPRWSANIMFYKRFIDDVIGIWLTDPDPETDRALWKSFCEDMDAWHGMKWDCNKPSVSVNFMDLTISIDSGRIVTTLFEKDLNLYLYIPPFSSHPRGVFTGTISGQILRIRRLCTYKSDADDRIKEFHSRLLARGHSPDNLAPLFTKAEENATAYLLRSPEEHEALRKRKHDDSNHQVYFHLQYHPSDPPSRKIQRLWRDFVSEPAGEQPLSEMRNKMGDNVDIRKLIVAYSRPLNLGNRFSVRNIHGRGKDVSKFLA